MTAKIMPFKPEMKPAGAPSKEVGKQFADELLALATEAENGEIQDFAIAIVTADGELDWAYSRPYKPRRILLAMKNLRNRVLEILAEQGARDN